MWDRNTEIQLRVLLVVTLANFVAQIPYFFVLYYHQWSDIQRMLNVPMLVVLALFLSGYILLHHRRRAGYTLLMIFLSLEFVFYLLNAVGEVVNGYGLFFHLRETNLILRAVFAIGYLNLFAAGYFLAFLIYKRSDLLNKTGPHTEG